MAIPVQIALQGIAPSQALEARIREDVAKLEEAVREVYFDPENVVHPAFGELKPGVEVQFIEEPAGEGAQAKRVTTGNHHFGA